MALDTVDIRIKVPEDLDVVLQALADDAGVPKTVFAGSIVNTLLERELRKSQYIYGGLKDIGMQSRVSESRGVSGKQRERGE